LVRKVELAPHKLIVAGEFAVPSFRLRSGMTPCHGPAVKIARSSCLTG
jgi:hypothetical protein